MELYADHPRDFADASLVVAAESLRTGKVFTVDRNDFEAYLWQRGHPLSLRNSLLKRSFQPLHLTIELS